jgi:hypothetical protein
MLVGDMPTAVGRTSPSVGRRDPLDDGRRPRMETGREKVRRLVSGHRVSRPIVRRYEMQV